MQTENAAYLRRRLVLFRKFGDYSISNKIRVVSAKRGERLKKSLNCLNAKRKQYLEEYPVPIAIRSNVLAPEVWVVLHLVDRWHGGAVLRDLRHMPDFVVGDADRSREALS